jgi:thiol:disulfide interchange protein
MIRNAWDVRSWMTGAMALTLLAGGCATAKKETHAAIAWNTAMNAALADAGQTRRPILLDFYTDW